MPQTEPIDCSIVVPCYRSGGWLEELVARTIDTMQATALRFEILLVNDASDDGTWSAISEIAGKRPCVRGIDMLFNAGQFRATLCGFEHARGELIVTLDDDLQHPPEEIPKLLDMLRSQPEIDCAIGAYDRKRHNVLRNLGSRLMARLNEAFYNKPRDLHTTSFRALRRRVAEAICAHRTAKPILGPLLLQSTRRIVNVEVEHRPRLNGKSGYSLSRLVRITFDNLISASTLPLKFTSMIGFVAATGSFFLGLYYLVQYLRGVIEMPGFATLVLLITFFGGMTLLSIGLLGEYVIRIIHEVARPPRYVVRQVAGFEGAAQRGRQVAFERSGSHAEDSEVLQLPIAAVLQEKDS